MLRFALALLVLLLPAAALAQNQPPVADAGPDQTVFLGSSVNLAGSASDPDDDPIVGWFWEVEASPPGSSPLLSATFSANADFEADTAGDYTLSLIASDGTDWSVPDFVVITYVVNEPPVAVASAAPTRGPAPLQVEFDATQSFDPEALPLLYAWDFGDSSIPTLDPSPTHSYEDPGTYFALLKVEDDRGQVDFDSVTITVLPESITQSSATDSGRYSSTGFHNPADTEYQAVVGNSRSFFVFDLTSVTDPRPIVSASLLLDTGVVSGGTFGGIDFTLYDVSTPIPTLVAGGDGLTAIYDDLGTGVAFSAATEIAPGTSLTEITIPLLPAGVAAVRAAKGGQLAIGGLPSGLGGNFAFDGTDVTGARLQIEFADAQVPMLSPLAGYVLVPGLLVGTGLIGIRRR